MTVFIYRPLKSAWPFLAIVCYLSRAPSPPSNVVWLVFFNLAAKNNFIWVSPLDSASHPGRSPSHSDATAFSIITPTPYTSQTYSFFAEENIFYDSSFPFPLSHLFACARFSVETGAFDFNFNQGCICQIFTGGLEFRLAMTNRATIAGMEVTKLVSGV